MTFNDYQSLVKEYYKTDSVSRRDEIEQKLYVELIALTKCLEELYNKYEMSFVDDSEWMPDRGGYSLSEFSENKAYLRYYDRWSYGGECDVSIVIPTKFFDVEERKKKEERLKTDYNKRLKNDVKDIDAQIERLKTKKENILAKLQNAESEACNE
jgi:hypothetical protein